MNNTNDNKARPFDALPDLLESINPRTGCTGLSINVELKVGSGRTENQTKGNQS